MGDHGSGRPWDKSEEVVQGEQNIRAHCYDSIRLYAGRLVFAIRGTAAHAKFEGANQRTQNSRLAAQK